MPFAAALLITLVGCGEGEPPPNGRPPAPAPTAQQTDEAITRIQNNPQLSDEQKQQAIAATKASSEMQRQMAQKAGQRPGSN